MKHILSGEAIRAMRRALSDPSPTSPLPAPTYNPLAGYITAFPGATHSGTRTNTTFFPLQSRFELRRQDWRELLKKSRYLRNASGVVRALFEKPVKFVCPGGLTPSASTPDEDYNQAADEYFEHWAQMPVDVTGQYNFYEAQEMIASEMPCDGDHFALKVKGLSNQCRLQFLRAHQVGDAPYASQPSQSPFINGVLKNAVGRPVSYRVLQDTNYSGIQSWRDYSAEDVLHIYDPNRLGFGRGLPWIYDGANSALDVLDMRALDMVARKLNLTLAGIIKRQGDRGAGLGAKLTAQELAELAMAASGQPIPPPSATLDPGPVTWERIMGGGLVPIMRDGEDWVPIDTDRDPINWIQAAEFLIREMCAGYGVSFEFLWNMAQLGGPTARMMLEDLAAFCEKFRRILVGRFCQPVRSWVIANGIIHGEIPEPKSGNWWECVWTGPAKVTIDRGRDGALFIKLLEKGMMTLDEWWSLLGKDSRRMRKKRIAEIREDLMECAKQGVPYAIYCASAPGNQGAPTLSVPENTAAGSPFSMALAEALRRNDLTLLQALEAATPAELRAQFEAEAAAA